MSGYYVHPTALVEENVQIGEGTRIWCFSHIMQGSVIGKNCNIGQNVYIDPCVVVGNHVKIQNNVSLYAGVVCEDGVFLGPSCVFTNVINPRALIEKKSEFRKTVLRLGCTIGANATIICGRSIGRYAMIGAGSVVTRDVPDYALVYGVPAVLQGWVCQCGETLRFGDEREAVCHVCGKHYKKDEDNKVELVLVQT